MWLRTNNGTKSSPRSADSPDADREMLVLRHLEQLSPAEIATALDLSVAAVDIRHIRAIVRIRTILESGSV